MDTKRESYRKIRLEEPHPADVMAILPRLGPRQREVYLALLRHGPMHNRRLSEVLGWPINSVTPRVNELVRMGYVRQHRVTYDAVTRRRVRMWEVTREEPRPG